MVATPKFGALLEQIRAEAWEGPGQSYLIIIGKRLRAMPVADIADICDELTAAHVKAQPGFFGTLPTEAMSLTDLFDLMRLRFLADTLRRELDAIFRLVP